MHNILAWSKELINKPRSLHQQTKMDLEEIKHQIVLLDTRSCPLYTYFKVQTCKGNGHRSSIIDHRSPPLINFCWLAIGRENQTCMFLGNLLYWTVVGTCFLFFYGVIYGMDASKFLAYCKLALKFLSGNI